MAGEIQERLLLVGAVGFTLLAVSAGWYLAHRTCDPHWMNRAGAAITALEALIVIAEFHRRERLNRIQSSLLKTAAAKKRAHEFLERQIIRAELHLVVIAVLLAMFGELLHGFGDLLFEALGG